MEEYYDCPNCNKAIRLSGSDCICDPKREYEAEDFKRQADVQLSGNGAGLGARRPIPDTQG